MQPFLLCMLLYKCNDHNPFVYFASRIVLHNTQLAERCQLFRRKSNNKLHQFVTCNESCVTTRRSADTPHSADIQALKLKSKRGEENRCVCGKLSLLTISLAGNVHPHTNTLKHALFSSDADVNSLSQRTVHKQ